jgi:hypothetical protein
MKRRSKPAVLGALALALVIAPGAAHAYCRTAACASQDSAWQVCTPAAQSDCGEPLYWPNRCVGYTLQKDASAFVSLAEAEGVFHAAFETWMNADCGGGTHPSIDVTYQGPVECHEHEYNKERGNANIMMFRDQDWPYGSGGILALTTVTYNKKTAEIYDADMELNSENVKSFTLGDSGVEFDLLSIVTHETGHFLGIAHTDVQDATMFPNYLEGTTSLRDLSPDDVAAICAAYPPTLPKSVTCDPEPRHGFSSVCAVDQPEPEPEEETAEACSAAGPGRGPSGLAAMGLLFGLGAALAGRRRRRGVAR